MTDIISSIPLTVTQLNNQVKNFLNNRYKNIHVIGEIKGLRKSISGHMYFTLKDDESEISTVLFSYEHNNIKSNIDDGDKVQLFGDITLYPPKGRYQFLIKKIKPFNEKGNIHKRYEQLKNKLESEGLFDLKYKKKIPKFPSLIGVVTSIEGAVIQDIINVSKRRSENVDLLISPSIVQGEEASKSIIKALDKLLDYNKNNEIDIIIIARGGGSFEDLNCFNDEMLARKIFGLDIPVISGVGHETDFTIIDFVSDLRASTPSAAAEISVPDNTEIIQTLDLIMDKIINKTIQILNNNKEYINKLLTKIELFNPKLLIENYKIKLLSIKEKIFKSCRFIIKDYSAKIEYYNKILNNSNPYNILSRGFTVILDKNNNLIKKINDVKIEESINIKFNDGLASAEIKSKKHINEKK